MKTLEQILEMGTPSEREIVKLAHMYPMRSPSDLVRYHGLVNILKSAGFTVLAASGLAGMYFVGDAMTNSTESFGSGLPLLALAGYMAYKGIAGCRSFREIQRAINGAIYERNPHKWNSPEDNTLSAFSYNGTFVLNPTPAQATIAKRVYPLANLDEVRTIKEDAYALVGAVYVDNITFDESSTTEAHGEAVWTTYDKSALLTLRRDGEEPFLFSFSRERKYFPPLLEKIKKDDYISLLLRVFDGHVGTLERIYPVFDDKVVPSWRPLSALVVQASQTAT